MKYTEIEVILIYDENLVKAINVLSSIKVARGRKPVFKGLNGWVFEQTIRLCLEDELEDQSWSEYLNYQILQLYQSS